MNISRTGKVQPQHYFAAVEYVVDGQDADVAPRVIQSDRLGAWINDYDQAGASFEPVGDLVLDLGVGISR